MFYITINCHWNLGYTAHSVKDFISAEEKEKSIHQLKIKIIISNNQIRDLPIFLTNYIFIVYISLSVIFFYLSPLLSLSQSPLMLDI